MERSQLFDLMGELKLYGMKAAFDEIMATAVKRQHEPQRIIGDLLTAEISEKQARSIKYLPPLELSNYSRAGFSFSRTTRRLARPRAAAALKQLKNSKAEAISSRMAGTPAQEEIDESTGKFLRSRSEIAHLELLA
jgi:hypothetical protein